MDRSRRYTALCSLALSLAAGALAGAPPEGPPETISSEISRADASMSAAFNAHDLGRLEESFARNLEFYHDKDGLLSYDQAMEGFRSLFAKDNGIRRELVGALEIYPIPNYGAIEAGSHRFCHLENTRNVCGVFKFVHIWRNEGGRWQITRAVSYDHK